MTSRQERYDLGPLADFMAEDILSTPGHQLVEEVVEDCGDPEALASAFDKIVYPGMSKRGDSVAGVPSDRDQLCDAEPSSSAEPLLLRLRGIATLLANYIFPNRLTMAVISATCVAFVVIIAVSLHNESQQRRQAAARPEAPLQEARQLPTQRAPPQMADEMRQAEAVLHRQEGHAASLGVAGLRSPQGGQVRAIVIGIDAYQFVAPLRGAVADARDIESTLRFQGVRDITALYDAAADRTTVMHTLDQLIERSRSGDLVVLSIASYGAQEPEHVKGSQPNGFDNIVVLPGFNPETGAGTQQRIIGTEFNHVIKQFEAKGTQVLFIVDASYGGGIAREVDPRTGEMNYRQAPRYSLAVDNLQPISTASDAFLRDIDFERTDFLAAVDRNTKAPEVRIPGVPGFRGALSYAVARAFEGAADENRDGHVSQTELFTYVRQVAYQLSDQRQLVVTSGPMAGTGGSDVIFDGTRGVSLLDRLRPNEERPQTPQSPATAALPDAVAARPLALPAPAGATPLGIVRVAVLGDQRDLLANLEAREARFEVVRAKDSPDLIWDPASLDVLAGGDVVARGIDRADFGSVIDREAAVNGFKRLAAKAPQAVRILPDDKVHRRDARIDVYVSGVAQRSLLMFNIAGDGTVQTLYPIGSDPRIIAGPDYKYQVRAGEPFGADQVVAISSAQRLSDLEEALRKMSQRRTAVEVLKLVERYAPADARIGAASLYTAP